MKKQNQIKSSDWLIKGYSKEELAEMKTKAIEEANNELKEKKIEEMAKDIKKINSSCSEKFSVDNCKGCAGIGDNIIATCPTYIATELYNASYRKVEENQVILTQEEYEYLCACELEYKEIADELENSKQEWISVKERLPKTEGDYLVWNEEQNRIEIRFFYRLPPNYPVESFSEIREYFGNVSDYKKITHWQPLPQPPQIKGAER